MEQNTDSLYPRNLRRFAPIPENARVQFEAVTDAVSKRTGFNIAWSMISSLDWTSSHARLANRHHIKIDWSLIEFASSVQAALAETDGSSDVESYDCLGEAPFVKLNTVENMIVGETFRFLCWKSIQNDNWNASAFFFDRFMDYFALSRTNMMSYRHFDERHDRCLSNMITLAVGHELGHLDTHQENGALNSESTWLRRILDITKNMPSFIVLMATENRIPYDEYTQFINSDANIEFLAELACDGSAVAVLLETKAMNRHLNEIEIMDQMADYAMLIRIQCWLQMLEFFLFCDDGDIKRQDTDQRWTSRLDALVAFNNMRIYFWTNFNISSFLQALERAGRPKIDLGACLTHATGRLRTIDRTLETIIYKAVGWRFRIKEIEKLSLFLSDKHSVLVNAMRRYPAFEKADHELAREIAERRVRGWTFTTD